MSTAPTRSITLPSKGILYGDRIPEGKVGIRKLLVGELSILESQGAAPERIDTILRACVTLPNAFPHADLLMSDRFALLLALRQFTFPTDYPVSFKCKECGARNKPAIKLEDLEVKDAAPDLKEPVEIMLPECGKKVGLRFLRGTDEEAVTKYAKRVMMQTNDGADPSNIHRLARQIVAIDDVAPANLAAAEEWVRTLTAGDSLRMRKAIDDVEPGVDLTLYPDCRVCGEANEMEMPFTAEFFRPTRL